MAVQLWRSSTGGLSPLISHHFLASGLSSRFLLRCVGCACQWTALTDMVLAGAAAAAKMTGAVLLVPPWQCADGASHLLLPHDPARPPPPPPPPPPPVVAVAHRCTEPHRGLAAVLPALVAAAVPFHPRWVAVLVVLRTSTSSSPAPRPPPHPLLSSSAGYLLSPCLVPSPRTSPLPPPPLHLLPLFLPLRLPLPLLLRRLSDRRPGCPRARDLRARPPQRTAWQAAASSGWLVHSGRPRCASICSAATRRTRRATARMWRRSPRLCVCDHRQPPPPPPATPTRRRRLPAPRRPPPPLLPPPLPPPLPPRPSPATVVHRRGTTWRSAAMTTRRRRRRRR